MIRSLKNLRTKSMTDSVVPSTCGLSGVCKTQNITLIGTDRNTNRHGQPITACRWHSNIDGLLSEERLLNVPADVVSQGIHTLHFSVKDDQGQWSVERTLKLFVSDQLYRIYTLPLSGVQES